jgi:hypothetical protein
MKVRIKIEKDKGFAPTVRYAERLWINLTDGSYFWVARSHAGAWFDSHTEHTCDYPSMDAAIIEGLILEYQDIDGNRRYRRIRAKERVYTITVNEPAKPGKRKPR